MMPIPATTLIARPAWATGGALATDAVIVTEDSSLLILPSLTSKVAT